MFLIIMKKPIVFEYVIVDPDGTTSNYMEWPFKTKPDIFSTLQIENDDGTIQRYQYAGTVFRIGKEKDYQTVQFTPKKKSKNNIIA